MITLLTKIFIHEDLQTPRGRNAYGTLCGIVGVLLNLLLFAGKYVTGLLSASVAITADAFNNLSDAASSLLTLAGFRIAGKKPDTKHPFGHGRAEYITGVAVSALVICVGLSLAKDSILKILHPEPVEVSAAVLCILTASICIKGYMFFYNRTGGRKIRSSAMTAAAADSISDAVSTAVVLIAMAITALTGWNADGWCGAAVSVFILITGVQSIKETLAPLLGSPPEEAFVREIEEIVLAHDMVLGLHDLIVHDYGPGRRMISLHAEVDGSGDIYALHDEIDRIERELNENLNCESVIHMDPVATDDAKLLTMKKRVVALIGAAEEGITLHDFRMEEDAAHTTLFFDVLVPFGSRLSDDVIRNRIDAILAENFENTSAVIEIDHPYI